MTKEFLLSRLKIGLAILIGFLVAMAIVTALPGFIGTKA